MFRLRRISLTPFRSEQPMDCHLKCDKLGGFNGFTAVVIS
jgi:hypothetical protein